MRYYFRCKHGHMKLVNVPIGQLEQMKPVRCDQCRSIMYRDYCVDKLSVLVPDYMQAGSEEAEQVEWVKQQLNTRPSGNDKSVY